MNSATTRWTLQDLANETGANYDTVLGWARRGRMPATKFGSRYFLPPHRINEIIDKTHLTIHGKDGWGRMADLADQFQINRITISRWVEAGKVTKLETYGRPWVKIADVHRQVEASYRVENVRRKAICSRPTCDRAIPGDPQHMDGLCFKHAVAAGLAQHLQPTEQAREIVLSALESGWRFIDIHRATGVNQQTLFRLRDGELGKIKHITLERLCALPEKPPFTSLPAGPTQKRIVELREAGFSLRRIGRDIGINHSTLANYSAGRRGQVTPEIAAKVKAYHQQHLAEVVETSFGQCNNSQCDRQGTEKVRDFGTFCAVHADETRQILGIRKAA